MSRNVYLFHLPAGYGTHLRLPKMMKYLGVLVGEPYHNDAMLFELDRRPIDGTPFVNPRSWELRREQEIDGNNYIKTEWMGTTTWTDFKIHEADKIWANGFVGGKYDLSYADGQTLTEKLLERITGRELKHATSMRKFLFGEETAYEYRQPRPVCSVM